MTAMLTAMSEEALRAGIAHEVGGIVESLAMPMLIALAVGVMAAIGVTVADEWRSRRGWLVRA